MKKTALILTMAITFVAFVNAQNRTEIKSNDLPKSIIDNIAKEYVGYSIQNAFKVNNNNHMTYEVIVEKGAEKDKLAYNENGNFIRKEPLTHMSAQNSSQQSSSAPQKRMASQSKLTNNKTTTTSKSTKTETKRN